jgi:hypothetical protein
MLRADGIKAGNQIECAAWSPAQRAAVLAEANDILAHPTFKNSKRCITLFRRLIDHALDGDQEGVKERTLGIEVFDRDPDYDTSADPIVRMTANEIRKRLAQYYQASNRRPEVKISLVPGTYLPQFEFEAADAPFAGAEADLPESVLNPVPFPGPVVVEDTRAAERASARQAWIWWLAAGLVVAAVALVLVHSNFFRSTQELLWAPILDSNEPVIICIADSSAFPFVGNPREWAQAIAGVIAKRELPPRRETPSFDTSPGAAPRVSFVDSGVTSRLNGWLSAHHRPARVQRQGTLTLEDMRRGPVVLVGAFDNMWSLVLLSDLRYRVKVDPVTQDEWVEDAQNLSRRDWKGSGKLQFEDSSVDYAIVTRILDPDTGKWILAAGGLGMHGTEAAGELLTDPAYTRILPTVLRSSKKNFQIVLKTTVIEGHNGPPQIVAVYTW